MRNGVLSVVPVIAPYADSRDAVRARHEKSATPYLEVHVATRVEVCGERDVKGLYAKQAAGELKRGRRPVRAAGRSGAGAAHTGADPTGVGGRGVRAAGGAGAGVSAVTTPQSIGVAWPTSGTSRAGT